MLWVVSPFGELTTGKTPETGSVSGASMATIWISQMAIGKR